MDNITLNQWLILAAVGLADKVPYNEDNISARIEYGDAPDDNKYNIIFVIKLENGDATIYTTDNTIADIINFIYESRTFNDAKLQALIEELKNISIEGKYRIAILINNLPQIIKI